MAGNDGIKIGAFGTTPNTKTNLPKRIVNKRIWFSPSQGYFVATDESNKAVFEFDFANYKKFVEAGVIVFTSDGIRVHMEKYLNEWERQQAKLDAEQNADGMEDDASQQDDFSEYGADEPEMRRASNRRDDREENMPEDKAAKQKDPTKHMGVFFAITLVIAIIAVVVIDFGEPIVKAVAPLIS